MMLNAPEFHTAKQPVQLNQTSVKSTFVLIDIHIESNFS